VAKLESYDFSKRKKRKEKKIEAAWSVRQRLTSMPAVDAGRDAQKGPARRLEGGPVAVRLAVAVRH